MDTILNQFYSIYNFTNLSPLKHNFFLKTYSIHSDVAVYFWKLIIVIMIKQFGIALML
jgi:hypothetical protein